MNILQIIPARSWGGGERYIYDLTEQLQQRNYNVTVVGRDSRVIADKFNKLCKYISLPLIFLFDFYSAFKLSRIIGKNHISVIHVHIFKDAFMAAFAIQFSRRSVRLVMTRHQVRKGKTGFMYRWLYHKLDRIIFVSDTAKDEFLSGGPVIESSKIVTVINSIDSLRLGHITPITELSNETVIGFAGRISPEKGIDKLIESLSILKNEGKYFTCKIAGTGDPTYVEQIKQMIQQRDLGHVISMVGFVSDMGAFISTINIAVLPSTCVESCSLMAIEYMASGRPLVASNRGGHSEIIETGVDGILVDAHDSADLARGLSILLDNPQLRNKLGLAAAQKYTEQLNFSIFIKKIIAQYEQS